ncbi:conserved hypothetical protein [Hyphomonas neptunium ATCC 15444]|uniref:DAGKc domain-containing protein n=2 Tax=Hyphomonas TaxID=85 RepID=Q0C1U5_HYPNA|nr:MULTISPECIES: diacylglycerol kinase family protein [Hyphomonas]ABI77896.1 conserved hypothetical protein [Hyphomonas neptunium ATCC 15444]KCZ92617.1 hypothetical protein HHI_11576 [Hyphomonas hirschiana VP5]
MSPRIGLIVSPLSHTVQRKGSILERVSTHVENAELIRIEDFNDLPDQLARLARTDVSAVLVEGGDGTLQAVMSAWPGLADGGTSLPDFAILPGGSTNLAYKIAGLKCRGADDIVRYIAQFRAGRPVTRTSLPALRVEAAGLARPQIGMLLSTGSLARAMIYTQQQIHGETHRGSLAVAEAAARFVFAPEAYLDTDGAPLLRSSELSVSAPSFQLRGAHALSLMTTLPSLSLGLTPFWGLGAGAIAFTRAAWPILHFRLAFLKILAGHAGPAMARHGLTSHRTDTLELACSGAIVLDGELLQLPENIPITISATSPLRFLR